MQQAEWKREQRDSGQTSKQANIVNCQDFDTIYNVSKCSITLSRWSILLRIPVSSVKQSR